MQKVFIGLPRLGQIEAESAVSAYVQATDGRFAVQAMASCSSLLANGFNHLFCNFLNDPSYDYFALHHADVYPHGQWLDVMAAALDTHQADVIHAVVPIKDLRGLTSTAVGSVGDKWSCRRLTLTEIAKLPDVFDAEDVIRTLPGPWLPYPILLPNTGVLLIRRAEWCKTFPGFCITDRIYHADGKAIAAVEPEDWAFGRWCAANGVRVLGTKAVKVDHYGRTAFPSYSAWGEWETDVSFTDGFNYNRRITASIGDSIAASGNPEPLQSFADDGGNGNKIVLQMGLGSSSGAG